MKIQELKLRQYERLLTAKDIEINELISKMSGALANADSFSQ